MKGRRNEWVHLSSVDKVALRIVCSSSFVRDVAARHRVDGGGYIAALRLAAWLHFGRC